MNRVLRSVSIVLLLCLVSIWALPVKKANTKGKRNVSTKSKEQSPLHEQEKELENLAKLQKEKANNVVFQTTKDIKVVQEDGQKDKVIKTSKNVVNADNGNLLSSVQKTVKSEIKGHENPKVTAITKVDIPSEHIHNVFTNDVENSEEEEEEERSEAEATAEKKNMPSIVSGEESDESSIDEDLKDLQKSSKVMANYLLETDNFERFEDALRDFVKVGLMTVSEANEYEKIVLEEYERLLALEKANELQAKAAQVPVDYTEGDYDIPYQVNDDMASNEQPDEIMNVKRYISRRRGMLPPPTRSYTGPEYADYTEPLQSYNGYDPNEMESAESQDSNEWLNRLLEQAKAAEYPEERGSYIGHSRENSPVEQERIRRIVQNMFNSESLSKGYAPRVSSEEVGNEEEDGMMEPMSEVVNQYESEEPVSALKSLAKMHTPEAKRVKAKSETKHQAKKQDVPATERKKKKKTRKVK